MNLKGRNFIVLGTGISGVAATELLVEGGYPVLLYDGNEGIKESEIREKSEALAQVEIVLGDLTQEQIERYDTAVLSPGVPIDSPIVEKIKRAGLSIWGEVELAYAFERGRVLAVTGTNGKTTTTSLLGEIMKNYQEDVKIVGNIGIPYTSVARASTKRTITVAEISSFQLETVHEFRPEVSAILNITPDHLNRHHTMEQYIREKERIAEKQDETQTCILNYEDPVLREFAKEVTAKVVYFSSRSKLSEGIYLDGDTIVWAWKGTKTVVCQIKELQLIGRHNYENVMAATAMALSFGVPMEKIKEVLVRFVAVVHRIEYVVTKRGICFYNDSKGTNPDAAIQAVQAMGRPTLLIGGGYDKNSSYEEWTSTFAGKVKKLVLLGATREKIAESAIKTGYKREDIVFVESLKEAVKVCYDSAESGDAVLLSPACASWGMFRNYEERGDMFKELVKTLRE